MSDELDRLHERVARARLHGFVAAEVPERRFRAKSGSHDDGPAHGMFLGPIGGPAFSRDLHGRFSRWHLQPGVHQLADIGSAFLGIRWSDGAEEKRCARLRREEAVEHEVSALHPMQHESFTFAGAPFRVLLTTFSPVIPGEEDLSALPVVVMDVWVEPLSGSGGVLPEVDIAAFWPNLNGWRGSLVTSTDRGDAAWPGHHHAGNVNLPADVAFDGVGVLQSRRAATDAPDDVCGDVLVSLGGDADHFSRQVQFTEKALPTGVPDADQTYTLPAVWDAFADAGRLGVIPDGSWPAHWHEPLASAVGAHFGAGRAHLRGRVVLAFDWPVVRFGQGRCWSRRYTAVEPAGEPSRAATMATRAHEAADRWLAAADAWHERTFAELAGCGWSAKVTGCVVNELNLVTSLGSAWLQGTPPGHRPESSVLPTDEHLGLLEGFDTGYFYYNTSDLFHYAFPALTKAWPRLADLVFADLTAALDAEDASRRPIYRPGEHRALLTRAKLPHDLGCAAEDPFVRLNGYSMRDDPNSWRDSNPSFVLATLAHHRLLGRPVSEATWTSLTVAAEVAAAQADPGVGVPRHHEFGDSTWDNLGLRGFSTYTAALCVGMWGVLAEECRARDEDPTDFETRRRDARAVLDELWTGRFFRAASEGKYTDAVMGDSVLGLYYAAQCGVTDLVPRERITSHLRTAYQFAHAGYHGGDVGPLLIAEERLRRYERDGGEELQVNEVLVGSAWLLAAMLGHFGLRAEAHDIAESLQQVLYGNTGLQFRTPAALDADGQFRAPLNMRPLAVWWLLAGGDL